MNLKSLLFSNTGARQTVVKNTFWLFAGELVGRLIRFAIVIYSARLLGAAEYGVFSYVLTIAAFVTIFSDIGISAILTRETSKNPENRQRYISASLALKGILILLNIAVVLIAVPLFTNVAGAAPLLPMVVFIFLFDSLREFGFGLNRALEQMQREAIIKIVMNLAISILGFAALWLEVSARSLAISYAIGSGIGFILTAWTLRSYLLPALRSVDVSLMWPIFKQAWPIGLLGLLGAIMINTDMVMLGWWEAPVQLGYYAAAQKIILLLYIIPSLIASATFPAFSRLARVNNERFRLILEQSITAVLLIALPIVTGGLVLAGQLMHLLFGDGYTPATGTFAILLATILIVYPSTLLSNALFAYDEQKRFMYFVSFGALSNAFFNWLLIPRFGIEGAAVATIGSQIITNIFVWRTMRQTNKFSILNRLPRIVASSILMAGVAYVLQNAGLPLIATVIISMGVYTGVLWLLKEPILHDIKKIVTNRS
jgi:O-antigen/teichoic acid export membrane protein